MTTKRKVICGICKGETNHQVLYEGPTVTRGTHFMHDREGEWSYGEQCDLLRCMGCDHHVLVKKHWHEARDPDEWGVTYHPPIQKHPKEKWFQSLPDAISVLLSEVIDALNNQNYILAVMGCRSVVDLYANEVLKKDVGGYERKLEAILDEDFISFKDYEILKTTVNLGNETVHQGYRPSEDTAEKVYLVTSHLVQRMYIDEIVEGMAKAMPHEKKHPRSKDLKK